MIQPVDVRVFFNLRSPYCYLVSKNLWEMLDGYHANVVWRPLGGWDGRSPPDRAKKKVPLARQDLARWAKKMHIPVSPPPITTDPTRAGAVSILAEECGVLHTFVVNVLAAEWADGLDIGQAEVLMDVGERSGLDKIEVAAAMDDKARLDQLHDNWREAEELGVIGVPTFVIGDQIFWGNDRLEFVQDHLDELGMKRA